MATLRALLASSVFGLSQGVDVVKKDVQMSGMICGLTSQQGGVVVYPADDSRKYPVIGFAHGFTDGGSQLDHVYTKQWNMLASAGYVIVAAKSAAIQYCLNEYKDQLHALEWAKTSAEVKDRIDWDMPTAIMGHSMGGRSTVLASSQADKVKALNIGAAVAENAAVNVGGCPGCKPLVPIMFTTGDKDDVVPPSSVKGQYEKTSGVPRALVEIKGVGHHDVSTNANLAGPYELDWLNCFIKSNSTACKLTQCGEWPVTTACETKEMPQTGVIV